MIDFVQKQFPNAKVYEGQHGNIATMNRSHDPIIVNYYWEYFELWQRKDTGLWYASSMESIDGPINDSILGGFNSIEEACEKLALSVEERLGPILEDMKNFKIKKEEG